MLSLFEKKWCSLFAFLFFLVLIPVALMPAVAGSTEAREMHIVKIMLETGEFALPSRAGILPSKPPFFHWVSVILASPFSRFHPEICRIVSLVFAFGTLLCTGALAKALAEAGEKTNEGLRHETQGFLAVVILALTYGFTRMAIDARVDMVYSFFVTVATVLCFEEWRRRYQIPDWRADLLFFVASGFAVLTKGPIGIVLPLVTGSTIVFLGSGFRSALSFLFRPRVGWLAFLVVAAPWYVIASMKGGSSFLDRQIVFENIKRFTGGEDVNTRSAWFYIPCFILSFMPWSLVWLSGASRELRALRSKKLFLGTDVDDRRGLQLIGWALSGIVLFSIPSGKRGAYLLPLFVPASIFVAHELSKMWARRSPRVQEMFRLSAVRTERFLALALLALAILGDSFRLPLSISNPLRAVVLSMVLEKLTLVQLALLTIAGLFYLSSTLSPGNPKRLLVSGLAILALFSLSLTSGLGLKGALKDYPHLAARVDALVPPGKTISVVRENRDEFFDPLMFYLVHPLEVVSPGEASDRCPAYAVATRTWRDSPSTRDQTETERKGPRCVAIEALTTRREQAIGGHDEEFVVLAAQGVPKLTTP